MASLTENQTTESTNLTANPHARVTSMPDNSHDYPPFDMERVPNYMNNQIIYYYMTGIIPAAELTRFHQLIKQQKVSLDLIGWNSTSDRASEREDIPENMIPPRNHD